MKVIFLDIDGVLTNLNWRKKRREIWLKDKVWVSEIDEEAVKLLKKIVSSTEAKIVLSSSWRNDWSNDVKDLKKERVIMLRALFDKYGIEVIGITPYIPRTENEDEKYFSWRENEIKYYLNEHPEITSFCVIDDGCFDLQTLKEYLVKTETFIGLQSKHVEQAIDILKRCR